MPSRPMPTVPIMQRFNTFITEGLSSRGKKHSRQRFCHLFIGTNFELFGRTCRRFPQKFEQLHAIHIVIGNPTPPTLTARCRIVTRLKLLKWSWSLLSPLVSLNEAPPQLLLPLPPPVVIVAKRMQRKGSHSHLSCGKKKNGWKRRNTIGERMQRVAPQMGA